MKKIFNNDEENYDYENDPNFIGVYSIYDTKGDRFDTPFHCMNNLFALRHYEMQITKEGSMLQKYADDFQLFRTGWFNLTTGLFEYDLEQLYIK